MVISSHMKFSWDSLKVSITGARLSHLVQKDSIWDHGSMTEQVKNIFYHVEKAKSRRESGSIRKYLTVRGYEQLDQLIKRVGDQERPPSHAVLVGVSVVEVRVRTNKTPDRFTALIKGKRKETEGEAKAKRKNFGIENFREHWFFMRQGDWWLLDQMR